MESKDSQQPASTQVKKVDRLSPTRMRLTIEIPGDLVSKHESATTQTYMRQARLPGFRPGKVPASLIKQKFKDEIRKDVISQLLEAGIGEAVRSTSLNPLNNPSVELQNIDFEKGTGFEFSAEFEVRPEIELKNYRGIRITQSELEPTQQEIQNTLNTIQERFSTLEPVDAQKPEKSQFVVVEMAYHLVDKPKSTPPKKRYTLQVGVGSLLAALDEALLESNVGEIKSIQTRFPQDYSDQALKGKEAIFQFTIEQIKRKNTPELNDEMAKQVKEGATLSSLIEDIKDSIRENKKQTSIKSQREAILKHLVEKHPFEVPASLVERQTQHLVQSIQEDMKAQGYLTAPKLNAEDLNNVRSRAEALVRGSLLLQEISNKEQIVLDESRYQQRLDELATRLNKPADELKQMLEGKGMIDRIRDDILTDQVFEFLIQNAVIG